MGCAGARARSVHVGVWGMAARERGRWRGTVNPKPDATPCESSLACELGPPPRGRVSKEGSPSRFLLPSTFAASVRISCHPGHDRCMTRVVHDQGHANGTRGRRSSDWSRGLLPPSGRCRRIFCTFDYANTPATCTTTTPCPGLRSATMARNGDAKSGSSSCGTGSPRS